MPAEQVEVAAAVGVPDVAALAADQDELRRPERRPSGRPYQRAARPRSLLAWPVYAGTTIVPIPRR